MGKETKRIGRSPHRNNQVPRHRKESTTQKIRDLDANIDALVIVDALVRQTKSPFIDIVMRARVSSKFKLLSQLRIYEGKTNPMGYLENIQEPNDVPRIFRRGDVQNLLSDLERFNENLVQKTVSKKY